MTKKATKERRTIIGRVASVADPRKHEGDDVINIDIEIPGAKPEEFMDVALWGPESPPFSGQAVERRSDSIGNPSTSPGRSKSPLLSNWLLHPEGLDAHEGQKQREKNQKGLHSGV